MFLLQKKTFLVSILVLAVSLIPAAPESFSQEMTKGELSGVVTDASGARVPAASVVATHITTQFTREAQSNDSGVYVMSFLPIGEYTLSAESSGFRKYSQSGINLGGGDKKVIDIVLEVGEVTDVIEVTAAAPLVDRSDATLGVNLEASTVATLPVNGRDFSSILILQPGAVQGGQGAFSSGNNLQRGGVHEPGERASISFNGAQDSWSSNNYTMDGIDVSEIHFGLLLANSISMESISEVVVDTTNYSAENGRSASGKINFISKSGGIISMVLRSNSIEAPSWWPMNISSRPQGSRSRTSAIISMEAASVDLSSRISCSTSVAMKGYGSIRPQP